ncbi:MAG: outer membrane protein transport protein, partial [Gallionellaceae bacterium]|nr:outer membrane protein transport protein [Gallionellaceae bacterium]
MTFNKLAIALAAAGFASGAYATNGMNLEGYGPIATGMGGASFAYDNGTAAVMNNPATLGLMGQGSRLDLAVGMLGPDVSMKVDAPAPGTSSGGDAYYMPALGWAKKDGAVTYGVALFAQGGMGTEWEDANFKTYYSADGMAQRSEVGVGRLIAPLAYEVNPNLVVGGSLDFVWAMMDLKMALPGFYFATAENGGLVTDKQGAYAGIPYTGLAGFGRIDFSDSNDYTGKAKATGWAGKL